MARRTTLDYLLILTLSGLAACEGATDEGNGANGTGGIPMAGSAGASAAVAGGGNSMGGDAGATGPGGGGMNGAGTTSVAGNGGSAGGGIGGVIGGFGGSASGAGGFAGAPGGVTGGGGAATGGSAGNAGSGGTGTTRPARVLLYFFSTLDIPSVPAQLAILRGKLESSGYQVDESEDPMAFTDTNLARYAAVGMINTCFYPFGANNMTGEPQSEALQRFMQQGGGLFGTHCADVTFQSANPPARYNQLLGGRASSENFEGTSECRKVGDHPTIAELPATFSYTGNLDNTNFIATDTTVLVRCRWANGTDVAVSWFRSEGSGRVFFTNFAKEDADLRSATLGEQHILPGLAWVLGREP
jgi:type 1 glutamine amidotransferase